jgi:hypothetical protein
MLPSGQQTLEAEVHWPLQHWSPSLQAPDPQHGTPAAMHSPLQHWSPP